jgi:hypothetical protein
MSHRQGKKGGGRYNKYNESFRWGTFDSSCFHSACWLSRESSQLCVRTPCLWPMSLPLLAATGRSAKPTDAQILGSRWIKVWPNGIERERGGGPCNTRPAVLSFRDCPWASEVILHERGKHSTGPPAEVCLHWFVLLWVNCILIPSRTWWKKNKV